ncbi:MAG TPA: hydrogenase, partial [Campylobacterales bacterium]|nr:hydrogenase [Campylobacterales bacterium]
RKIYDDFGLRIAKTYDNRPLTHHERFLNISPMKKSFTNTQIDEVEFKPYRYKSIKGDGVFNVSVGPIHAGIIEPGHFHFSQAGENILFLEVRHGYKYRGIEKMCEGKGLDDITPIISRISGNESIAYQIALYQLKEQALGNDEVMPNIQHAILLELERLVHHFTDIGFIPNDAGFGASLTMGSVMAEDTKRILTTLTNSRFGFDSIGQDIELNSKKSELSEYLYKMNREIKWFEDWIMDIPSLWDRLDTTGILTTRQAIHYDTVGVVARASGLKLDRRDNEFYKQYGYELQREAKGDVGARFKLRIKEINNSLLIIENMLNDFKEYSSIKDNNYKDGEYISFVESSIGELMMYLKLKDGVIDRLFIRDPSFINWQSLHLMMTSDIIADFPLINKSCDLSYAGCDL